MSATPFMQFYVADYLGDTQHLTTEQHGAYLLLLMAMWRAEGRLPNDPSKLARIARVSLRRWHILAGELMAFFEVDGSDITQKRLTEERQKAVSISEKRSVSGKLGVLAKSLKNNEMAQANASDLLKHSQIPEPEGSSDNSENIINVVPAGAGSPPDDRYAFQGETIRLSAKDLEAWRRAFPHLSLEAELWALDEWAGEQKAAGKKWFTVVSNALAKKERTVVGRIHLASVPKAMERRLAPDPRI